MGTYLLAQHIAAVPNSRHEAGVCPLCAPTGWYIHFLPSLIAMTKKVAVGMRQVQLRLTDNGTLTERGRRSLQNLSQEERYNTVYRAISVSG